MSEQVHQAVGAGRWFPGSRAELSRVIEEYINAAKVPDIAGRLVGLIVPHAGYMYSGPIAGYAFRAVREHCNGGNVPDVVVVLGVSHRSGFAGVALLDGVAMMTPLGEARLDSETVTELSRHSDRILVRSAPHAGEHSAENQVPFIQTVLPGVPLVLGLIGDHESETVSSLVSGLSSLAARKKVLVVASSDMLHDADYELVGRTDRHTLDLVAKMDYDGIERAWGYDRQLFCGMGAVSTVMRFAEEQGVQEGSVLCYRNSGDDYPESRGQWVVGYGSVVFAASRDS